RGPEIEIAGSSHSAIYLKLKQRVARVVVEPASNRTSIIILLRQRLLRRAHPVCRRVNRIRLSGPAQPSTAAQCHRVFELAGERSTGGHVHVLALREQSPQRAENVVGVSARAGTSDRSADPTSSANQNHSRIIWIALDLASLSRIGAGELAGDRKPRAVRKRETIDHDFDDARLLPSRRCGKRDDAAN